LGILNLGADTRQRTSPSAASADAVPRSTDPGERLPRRFGDFLLTSFAGSDGLGRVYRGLVLGESGEFVRVRVFDAPGLPQEMLADVIRRGRKATVRISARRPRGERTGVTRGTPWLAWSEMHGWTLDDLLAELGRRGRRLPLEHVLLIADGVAKALETGGPHGLVWPGLLSITRDGDVRLAGFGLSEGILPALDAPGVSQTLGPYVAPEVHEEPQATSAGDVYSVAAIALELVTGYATPFQGLGRGFGADAIFPNALARILRAGLARKRQRFASPGDLRRELGQFMVGSNFLPSSFHFSRYLRGLDEARETPQEATVSRGNPEMPDVPPVPVLEETEIEDVLQRFWGQIEGEGEGARSKV
jgi:hypothetical protein